MSWSTTYGTYDLTLVGLSYLISVLGSFAALRLAQQLRKASAGERGTWLGLSALAMGGVAIWSMHFIGMVAFDAGMPVSYNIAITLLSLVIAIVVTGLGLWLAGSREMDIRRLLGGGTLMGLGVAGMHYTGMAAMRMNMTMSYDPTLFAVSLVIAVVASSVALWLAFKLELTWHLIGAALVMGVAVCGMHYTGMAALILTPVATPVAVNPAAISPELLAYSVFLVSLVVISGSLVIVSNQVENERLA
jgi:NO-binding membrane sensor protein with MHYT domain